MKGQMIDLFKEEIKFCGHIFSKGQRRAAPRKLEALRKWTPEVIKTVKQLKGFLGLAQYYAIYMPGFAKFAVPLMEALKGDKKKVVWTEDMVHGLEEIKRTFAKCCA